MYYKSIAYLMLGLVVLFSFAGFAYAADAVVAYRSNTGSAPANEIPKIRFWDSSGSGSWGPEIELPSVGDEISYAVPIYSPVSDKIVIIVQDTAGNLNGYVCMSDCNQTSSWIVTRDIGSVSFGESSDRRFDVQFESSSGDAILVYEVFSVMNTKDLGYKVLSAASNNFSGLTEYYIDDTGHCGMIVNTWISLAAHPSNDELIVAAIDSTHNDINAWVWNGSSWGNHITISSNANQIQNGEALAVEYATDGTKAMVIGAEGTWGNVNYAYWNGISWSSVSSFDIDPSDSGDVIWATLKADPSSDAFQATFVDSRKDLTTAYWNGSSWSITANIEEGLDSFSTRVADFAWLSEGSAGVLVWENDGNGNTLSHTLCTPECNGSTGTISGYSGAGDFLTLLTNPDVSDAVDVLGLRLHTAPSAPDIGSFYYNGSSYSSYGDSVISSKARSGFEIGVIAIKKSSPPQDNCPIINAPGTYIQSLDFTGAPNNASAIQSGLFACVLINSSNVIFDCNGYSITGDGTDAAASQWAGLALKQSLSNITIRNCPGISNYSYGVYAYNSGNITISNSLISNVSTGIYSGASRSYDYLFDKLTFQNTTSNPISISTAGNVKIYNTTLNLTSNLNLYESTNIDVVDFTAYNTGTMIYSSGSTNHSNFINIRANNISGAVIDSFSNTTVIKNLNATNIQRTIHLTQLNGGKAILQNISITNSSSQSIYVFNSDNLTIDGVHITNTSSYGAYLDNVKKSNITNINISKSISEGIHYKDGYNLSISNANFSNLSYHNFYVTNSANISISDTTINGGSNGIFMQLVNNSQLSNIHINNSAYALYLTGCNKVNVSDIQLYNSSYTLIELGGSSNVNITSAYLRNATGPGYYLIRSSGENITIKNSDLSEGYYGIYVSGKNISLENNTISSALYRTVDVSTADNVVLTDNAIYAGGTSPSQTSGAGIGVYNSNISGSNNRLYNNRHDLIINYPAILNLSNTIFDNPLGNYQNFTNLSINDTIASGESYYINWTSNSSALPADAASFHEKWVKIENLSTTASIDSVVWHWTDAEASGYDETTFTIIEYDGSWSYPGAILDSGENTLTIAPLSGFSEFGIVEFHNLVVSDCMVIDTPGDYTQTANLSGAPYNAQPAYVSYACIVINAQDVSYDCNGYYIHNNGTSNAGAIVINNTRNVTVKNCPGLAYYDIGLSVFYSNESLIENVTSHSHNANAFNLVGSHYNNFINNTGHSASGTIFQIAGGHTNNNLINNLAYNGNGCFYLYAGAANITAINNTAYSCGSGDGFQIGSGSNNNTIINNTAYHANNGFNIAYTATNSTIENNLAYENSNAGFNVIGASINNLFINNTARDNGQQGFIISQNSNYNDFINSASYNNGAEGFVISQSVSYNNYINTTSYNNGAHGFYIHSGSSENNFTNTKSFNNSGHGLLVLHSQYNIFENTESCNNSGDGLRMYSGGSYNSTFTNTSLHGNDIGLFATEGSSYSNFTDTRIYNNAKGMILYSGGISYGNFTNLQVFNNSVYGINMSQSGDILFDSVYFSNNGYDIIAGVIGTISYEMHNAIFDNPAGTMENFTNLTILDDTYNEGFSDAYYINWTISTPPSGFISFEQKWIEIANITENVSIDNISWHWTDAEAVSYDEAALEVWKNNGTWSGVILDPDTGANTLSDSAFNPASLYGIVLDVTPPDVSLQSPTNTIYGVTTIPFNFIATDNGAIDSCWYVIGSNPPVALPGCNNITIGPLSQGDYNITVFANDTANNTGSAFTKFFIRPEDDNGGKKSMRFSHEFICPGDLVKFHTETSPTNPLSGVSIKILYDEPHAFYLVDTITTDSNGDASIQLTSEGTYRIIAEKDNYITVHHSIEFGFCPPSCTSDDGCAGDQQCVDGICEPVECAECGIVKDHQCIVYECCSDSDCPEGATCQDHNCQFECYSDSDCDTKAYCSIENNYDGGSCVPVTGICGYAENHIWNSYECGEPDCPPCTTGRCEDHQCVERDLLCPENAEIGSEVTCLATQNNASCDGCTIEVTHPDGTKTSGKTDDGRFAFPIDNAGIYIVSLVVNGEALISEEVSVALPIIPMLPDGLPLLEIVAILAIIGLLLLLLLLWKRKKGIVAELITKTPALGKPVQVKVEDKSHKGIGKIGVSVFHNGKLSESGMSAKKGEFSFTPKKKGSYAVHIMGRKKPETTFEL